MSDESAETLQASQASSSDTASQRSSLLDQLGEMHEELRTDRHLDLDIPGYEGKLFARFRPYSIDKSEKKARAMQKRQQRGQPVILEAAIDNIIEACEQLFVRSDDGRELPIDDTVPVVFEKRLAQMLKFDDSSINTARDVVIMLFPTQQSILKISTEIGEWLNTASKEADEGLLGN